MKAAPKIENYFREKTNFRIRSMTVIFIWGRLSVKGQKNEEGKGEFLCIALLLLLPLHGEEVLVNIFQYTDEVTKVTF